MSHTHVSLGDLGLSPRAVTRRDALRLFMGAGLCATLLPSVASATTTQEKLDAAQLSYDEAQAELDVINEEYAAIAGQLAQTQVEMVDVTGKIDAKQAEIDATQEQIDATQAEIESKQEALGDHMSSAYKSGPQSALDMLLSSATFEELTSNIYYLDKVSESERRMIEEVKTLKAELEVEKAELEVQKGELEAQRDALAELQAQQEQQLSQAQAKQIEAESLVGSLSAEVQELMAQRDAELIAAQKAAEEARRLEEERKQQQQQQGGSSSGGGWNGSIGGSAVVGTGSLQAVVNASYSTPSPGSGLCAAWVTNVFSRAGVGGFGGNACDMFSWYCGTSTSAIQAGMIIATPSAPYGSAAMRYGHVGIYIGGGTVRHNQSGVVKNDPLGSWVSMYSKTAPVLCGWLGGIALS